ncbi:hypothetical protein C0J52_26195, partial [Blattella germanica]
HVLEEVREDIHRESIDIALINIENWIKAAVTEKKELRSKLWFDKECYRNRMETILEMRTAKKECTEEALQTWIHTKQYENDNHDSQLTTPYRHGRSSLEIFSAIRQTRPLKRSESTIYKEPEFEVQEISRVITSGRNNRLRRDPY